MMNQFKKFRLKVLLFITHQVAVPLLMFCRKEKNKFNYSMTELENFPEGTLGKDLVEYLKKMNFKLLKYYERHDCKHILFSYEMDELGEAGMQFYFLGNGTYSIPTITSVFAYFVLMPENIKYYVTEFKKGKQYRNGKIELDQLNFNELVKQNTQELRKQFNIPQQ